MRAIVHKKDENSILTVFLLHGSTQLYFSKNHPLVILLEQFPFNVVSLELPGHGESPFKKKVMVNELISTFTNEMKQIAQNWNEMALIGYSLGGSLAFKYLEQQQKQPTFIITLGTGFALDEEERELIRMFFSDSFFESVGWKDAMLRAHRNWNDLIISMADWYHLDTPLLPNLEVLKQSEIPILSLLGDQDEPFPAKKNQPFTRNINNIYFQTIRDCAHFDYFAKAWPQVQEHISLFLQRLGFSKKK